MKRILVLCALLGWGTAAAAPPEKKTSHDSITKNLECSACHSTNGWAMVPGAGGAKGFDHAKTGFPLKGAHATAACTNCHDGRAELPRACAGCHQDAHAAKLGDDCASCHSSIDWRDTRTLMRHQRTRLPLTGKHATIECTACHAATTERTYSNVPADCFACHEKDYRATSVPPFHPDHVANQFSRECGQCHNPTGWIPALPPPTVMLAQAGVALARAHDARFVISWGKHRGTACASCHPVPDAPHVVACTGCHAHDVPSLVKQHGGRVTSDLGVGCLRCHPGGMAR
jgi:hypothetical protein